MLDFNCGFAVSLQCFGRMLSKPSAFPNLILFTARYISSAEMGPMSTSSSSPTSISGGSSTGGPFRMSLKCSFHLYHTSSLVMSYRASCHVFLQLELFKTHSCSLLCKCCCIEASLSLGAFILSLHDTRLKFRQYKSCLSPRLRLGAPLHRAVSDLLHRREMAIWSTWFPVLWSGDFHIHVSLYMCGKKGPPIMRSCCPQTSANFPVLIHSSMSFFPHW